jgi:large conductance mechanosensitive channel
MPKKDETATAHKEENEQGSDKDKKRFYHGFFDFIREQGVVGLAIGLAIGAQTNTTVKSIVDGLVTPIVGFLIGSGATLAEDKWNVVGRNTSHEHFWLTLGNRQLVFAWGQVLSSLIELLAVAAVIYFVVKGLGLDRLDKKKS